MPVGEVRAYANVSAEALANNVPQNQEQKDNAVSDAKLKQVLKKIADKNLEVRKEEGLTDVEATAPRESKSDGLLKGLLDGKSGPTGKAAAELFKNSGLAKFTSDTAKTELGETTQKTPQAGFNAASSFNRMSATPGAEKAMGNSAIASEALVVTTQTAKKGGDLEKLESSVKDFIGTFADNGSTETVKKKVFSSTAEAPGSERHKAAMDWGKSKSMRLQTGPAQESMANLLKKADPNNPAKFTDTLKGLEKFTQDPKLLSPKLNSKDMMANFSNLTKAATGGEKLSVTLEAQEKILQSTKFHAMPAEARAKIQAAVGRAPQSADDVAGSLRQVRDSRLPKFAQKLAQRGTDPEALKQAVADCKTREVPFPPIEKFDPNAPRDPKRMIAFKAKWNRAAQQIDNHNAKIAKGLNKAQSLRQLNDLDVPRGFSAVIGTAKNAQELAEKLGCSPEEAEYIMELNERCEDYKNKDLQIAKKTSAKRRTLRNKPEARADRKEKRAEGAPITNRMTIALSEDEARSSTSTLKKLLATGGATSKTTAPTEGPDTGTTTSTPAPTKEEVAARNSQTFKASGTSMQVGGARMKGWGNNTIAVGMDKETRIKELAKKREVVQAKLANDPTKVRGGLIGKSSDFVPLSDIVANKTPWIQLSPAVKAALRNLQITPNILESWQTPKPIYSQLQAKPWGELKEIQWKSAQLVGLSQVNWDALAGVLSTAVQKGQRQVTGKKFDPELEKVKMKGGA